MKRLAVLALLFLGCAWSAAADDLNVLQIVNTGAMNCPYSPRWTWTNPQAVPIYISRVHIWHGLDYQGRADLNTSVYRGGALPMLITFFGQDRYADPNGPTEHTADFGRHSIKVLPGQALWTDTVCVPISVPAPHGHHAVTIGYTLNP